MKPESPILSNDIEQLINMTQAGLGFMQVIADAVRGEIARGERVAVLEECSLPFPGFDRCLPTRQPSSTTLRVFMDFPSARVDTPAPALVGTKAPRNADRLLESATA